ncbi:hypothetical protein ACFOOM_28230 [Streptomyces echinoruber]|uniref:hypothetical protein n=1 Tax=Streptomyces echinoruber TaxID=68898 RepID=UPI00361CDCA7
MAFGVALPGSVFTTGARHTLARRHRASARSVAREVAAGQSAGVPRSAPARIPHHRRRVIRAAAANGIGVLLLVAGPAGIVAAPAACLMIRQRPSAEDAPAPLPTTTPSGELHPAND